MDPSRHWIAWLERAGCSRCRSAESIPTHQHVKFDGCVRDLCRDCWEAFHRWFWRKERDDEDGSPRDD